MKKFLAAILAFAMIFCLSACGNNNSIPSMSTFHETLDPSILPLKADYAAGREWKESTQPTHFNGEWAQAYHVIEALTEMAAAFEGEEAKYTYRLACNLPKNSAAGEFLDAWANAITIVTKGGVDIEIGYSDTYTSSNAVINDLRSAAVDFAMIVPSNYADSFTLTNVIQNPSLGISNATVGSNVIWELYKNNPDIQYEYSREGEVLFVWTGCRTPLAYSGNQEVDSVKKVNGNIWTNYGPTHIFAEEAGGAVFKCAIGDINNNFTTGVLSYLITDWQEIHANSLAQTNIVNSFIDVNIGCPAYALLCNNNTWNFMPAEYRNAIKAVSGDYLINLVDIWNYWEATARYTAKQNGINIYSPTSQFQSELRNVYNAVSERWIAENGETGESVYNQILDLIKQYN